MECFRCGNCCTHPYIVFDEVDLDKGDPRELIRYYSFHKCEPSQIYKNGKRLLAIRIPIPCQHYDSEEKSCRIYETRPVICKEHFCNRILEEMTRTMGDKLGVHTR